MAYQNVGTPRFYVCTLQWLKAQGLITLSAGSFEDIALQESLIGINPTNVKNLIFSESDSIGHDDVIRYNTTVALGDIMPNDNNFSMILGHNFSSAESSVWVTEGAGDWTSVTTTPFVNIEGSQGTSTIDYDGFSILVGNDSADITENIIQFRFDYQGNGNAYNDLSLQIGSLLYGTYFDMPHSPDLSLKMSIEMDGVKNIKTRGGVSLTSINYTKPQDWGNRGAWQLGNDANGNPLSNLRSGRRVWDLSFSYLSDSDLSPVVHGTNNILSDSSVYDGLSGTGIWNNSIATHRTILTSDDFFSQVVHKTNGGQLPFIFQPDKDNNNPDQFAICRFDMKSLQYNQVANNVYNVKLKIRECW